MAAFEVPENPEYTENIRKFEVNDPGHADVFNAVCQGLVNNDAYLKLKTEKQEGKLAWFCVCGSRKADVEKTVDAEGFRLFNGVRAVVYFTWGNTAENITLNINGTGAHPVKHKNAPVPAGAIQAEWAVEVAYHAGCWRVVGDLAEHRADKMKTEIDALKERVGFLELSASIQTDLLAGVIEKTDASQTEGKLWVPSDSGMGYIYRESMGRSNEKCAVVIVEPGRAYTVVTYIKEEDKDSVFAALEAAGAGAMNSYRKDGNVFSGKGGKRIFKVSPSSQFLLVNSCGSSADIEVYKSTK